MAAGFFIVVAHAVDEEPGLGCPVGAGQTSGGRVICSDSIVVSLLAHQRRRYHSRSVRKGRIRHVEVVKIRLVDVA